MTEISTPWLQTMLSLVGTSAAADNTKIVGWDDAIGNAFQDLNTYAHTYTNDHIAWCGHTMAYVMAVNGIKPPDGYLLAANWANWGVPAPAPQAGAIVVVRWSGGSDRGGHHVTLLLRVDGNTYICVGGNQSHAVTSTLRVPRGDVIALRWPAMNVLTPPATTSGIEIYQKLLIKFKQNLPKGVPPDGGQFGIVTGAPEEWACFGVSVSHAESGFDPRSVNTSDPGGSFGIFQYAHSQAYWDAYDIDKSIDAFVRDCNASVSGLRSGILGQRFSTIGRHPERGSAWLSEARQLAAKVPQPSASTQQPQQQPPPSDRDFADSVIDDLVTPQGRE
jgi:uncharacterized protein (TIGR02594 family)